MFELDLNYACWKLKILYRSSLSLSLSLFSLPPSPWHTTSSSHPIRESKSTYLSNCELGCLQLWRGGWVEIASPVHIHQNLLRVTTSAWRLTSSQLMELVGRCWWGWFVICMWAMGWCKLWLLVIFHDCAISHTKDCQSSGSDYCTVVQNTL